MHVAASSLSSCESHVFGKGLTVLLTANGPRLLEKLGLKDLLILLEEWDLKALATQGEPLLFRIACTAHLRFFPRPIGPRCGGQCRHIEILRRFQKQIPD